MDLSDLLIPLHQLSSYKVVTRLVALGPHQFIVRDYRATGLIDDLTYKKNPELWEHLPRCFGTVEVDGAIIRIVCGLRKFGDEKEYRAQCLPNEIEHREFYLTKANGEYSSISCFRFQTELFMIVRSKNVSLILRPSNWEADLSLYIDARYGFGVEIARLFGAQYFGLNLDQQAQIVEKLLLYTMSAEHCVPEHQHLVDYGGARILFPFALTHYAPSHEGLTGVLPDEACQWFISVGLHPIPIRGIIGLDQKALRSELRYQIFTEENSEGAVVYTTVINTVTGRERVYQVYKYKNYRYIFWRAVRERIRARSNLVQLRFRLLNLHCEVPDLHHLIERATAFYAYLWYEVGTDQWETIFPNWVSHWQKFESLDSEVQQTHMTQFLELQRGYQQLQIMPVGIPGSGKSTCLKIMQQLIPGARRLNQDECQKSSKIYHRTLAKLSRDPKIPVLLMDKCNHNRQVRAGTYNTIHRQTLIHIIFYHPNDIDPGDLVGAEEMPLTHALKLATERILSRGLGHANLYPSFELAKIMNGFTKSFELPDLNEIDPGAGIMLMDMTWAPLTMAERLMDWLREKNLLHAPPVSSREMEMALHNVTTEEGALAHKNESKAKVQSWVAHVLDPGPIYTDPLISQILAERQFPPKSELHLTLYYQGVNQSFDPRVLGPYNGSMVDLEITHVAYDDKAVALRVQSSIPCQNKHPHLTVAHRPDTASVYSNTLLMDPPFEYPLAIRVPARVVRYCKT